MNKAHEVLKMLGLLLFNLKKSSILSIDYGYIRHLVAIDLLTALLHSLQNSQQEKLFKI